MTRLALMTLLCCAALSCPAVVFTTPANQSGPTVYSDVRFFGDADCEAPLDCP